MNLRIILDQYPQCLESRAKLSAILRDLYHSERREINIVLDIYECGIADKIKQLKSIDALQVQAFCRQLEVEYALPGQYALRGIALWLDAYSVPIQKDNQFSEQQYEITWKNNSDELSNDISGISQIAANTSYTSEGIPEYELRILTLATVEIARYHGLGTKTVVVPSIIDGKTIVGIGKDAFKHCSGIECLEISEGIRYIDDGAFACCSSLKKCLLPQSLVRLGSEFIAASNHAGVFESTSLEQIVLPSKIRHIGKYAFKNCVELKEAVILSNVECLPEGIFFGCSTLTIVNLPDTIKTISEQAFALCVRLQRIALPPCTKDIGKMVFVGCTELSMVRLNAELTSIQQGAFINCANLKEIYIPSSVCFMGDHLFDNVPIRKSNSTMVISKSRCQKSSLLIYCALKSYALEYAQRNNMEFQIERH